MRVLVWQESFWPSIGGISASALLLLEGLQNRGHDFAVATIAGPGLPARSIVNGVTVHRFPFANALKDRDLDTVMAIRERVGRLKQEFAPELIHVNGLGPSVFYHFATERMSHCPLLTTLHSTNHFTDMQHTGGPGLLLKTLRTADWVTVVSKATLVHALKVAPDIESRASVVYPGIAGPALQSEPLPFDPPSILCIGNLHHHKGFDLLLRAGASLRRDRPGLRILIAGEGPSGPSLRRLAADAGIADCVEFVGPVERAAVPALINRATMVVVPSRRETFGLVALEAAVMARPVVAADTGGLPEIVDHGTTGLLVPADDAIALEGAISHLLDRPHDAVAMGLKARRRALSDFSLEQHVSAYDALYRRLVG